MALEQDGGTDFFRQVGLQRGPAVRSALRTRSTGQLRGCAGSPRATSSARLRCGRPRGRTWLRVCRRDPATPEQVEAVQRQLVDGDRVPHCLSPRLCGRVAGEAAEECEERRLDARRHPRGRRDRRSRSPNAPGRGSLRANADLTRAPWTVGQRRSAGRLQDPRSQEMRSGARPLDGAKGRLAGLQHQEDHHRAAQRDQPARGPDGCGVEPAVHEGQVGEQDLETE